MTTTPQIKNLAVLTSGGDAQGMNAAVRAVVRSALNQGANIYAIYEGYQGMIAGGDKIQRMDWDSVGGMLHRGGTVIGSARCAEFQTREGRRRAAFNLLQHNINGLIVIGGDGSLTGANIFSEEWPELVNELAEEGKIDPEIANAHPGLALVGMVGSIDNDMFGTDMTIGADSALHRIVDAIDAIASTAASHQRAFVIEVMGRHCGYLALMTAIATAANWVLIPENPPQSDNWEALMCKAIKAGREIGRRHNTVIVAEGACDRRGNPITSSYVQQVLTHQLGEDTRITILGHVQRGGAPSAFDRNMSTVLGYIAVQEILAMPSGSESKLIGIKDNEIIRSSLMEKVIKTRQVAEVIKQKDYEKAMAMRGRGFVESYRTLRTLARAQPHAAQPGQKQLRLAVMHSGSPAPGMNTAARAAIRLGLDRGHTVLAIRNGFSGLLKGNIAETDWMSVHGWVSRGGAELGTNRSIPKNADFEALARRLEEYKIDGLLIIGGWTGYHTAYQLAAHRSAYPAFNIPVVCLPATINNDLPGTELTIGADTALNNIVSDVDKIKESAVATRRCFVVEVMGRDCGYLALGSGMASGAEQVYLPEEGISLDGLRNDIAELIDGFEGGKRLGLMIRSENADSIYTTGFLVSLFEKEGGNLFDVRQAVLGHIQRGGSPTPFDRIQATRLATAAVAYLIDAVENKQAPAAGIGRWLSKIEFTNLEALPELMATGFQRPKEQWWLRRRKIADIMARQH